MQLAAICDATTSTIIDFDYGYDAAGQLTSTSTTLNGATVVNDYGFDEISQLATVSTTPAGGTAELADPAATPAGLLTTTLAGDTLTYNAAQQVTEVDAATGPSTTFAYDARGSRTAATVAATDTAPATTTGFEYTAAGALASVELPPSLTPRRPPRVCSRQPSRVTPSPTTQPNR